MVVSTAGAEENVRCTCVLFLSTLLVLNNAEHIKPIMRCKIKREEDERAMRYIVVYLEYQMSLNLCECEAKNDITQLRDENEAGVIHFCD